MPLNRKVFASILSLAACGLLAAPANAKWRFHPEHCPALVDRPSDIIPEGSDGPVAVCPVAAWAWRGEPHLRPPAPEPAAIHYHHDDKYYYRLGPDGESIRILLP
ncbi:MAG: hypothetical protein AAGC95_01585 [Pseudomonadota bacterium]